MKLTTKDLIIGFVLFAAMLAIVFVVNRSMKQDNFVMSSKLSKIPRESTSIETEKPLDIASIYQEYLAGREDAEVECFAVAILTALGRSGSGSRSSRQIAAAAQRAYVECMKEKGYPVR